MNFLSSRNSIAVALISAIILSPILLLPLSPDNSTYQSMGWELYAHGGLPYIASWDMNFPGVVYLHWLSIALFGNSDLGFRTLDLCFNVGICLLLASIVRRWYGNRAAFIAAVFYALAYATKNYWRVGQRDTFALFFILAVIDLCFRIAENRRTLVTAFLIGASFGFASIIRPTYALYLIAIPFVLYKFDEWNWRRVTVLIIGGAVIWLAFLISYAFSPGQFTEFYYSTIRFNLDIYGMRSVTLSDVLGQSSTLKLVLAAFTVATLSIVITLRVRKDRVPSSLARFDRALIIAYFACAGLSVLVMGKFFSYHFEPLLAASYCVLALAVNWMINRLSTIINSRLSTTGIVGLFLICLFPLSRCSAFIEHLDDGLIKALDYSYAREANHPLLGYEAEKEISQFIAERSTKGEAIELCSVVAGIRWRSERPQATRFTTAYALVLTDKHGGHTAYQERWRLEFVEQIRRVRPRFIVIEETSAPLLKYFDRPLVFYLSQIEGFDALLTRSYRSDTVIRGYRVFERQAT